MWTERTVCVGGAGAADAALWGVGKARTWGGACLPGKNDRDEYVTKHAIDPFISRRGSGAGSGVSTALFRVGYTAEDIALLAELDRAHERLSGPATRRILEREYEKFGNQQYERLAKISVGHLYNLRASMRYRNQAAVFEKTRPTAASIGEWRKPEPKGRPALSGWTRCTKATETAARACITSTRWIR